MPGLTKIPIDGQPKSIVGELEDMARSYIKGDNAIILAVTPANADLATSDALHLAREVDPSGDRTIGVLTKLDIMDPGTNARDVLAGASVRLKHGWIGIVNRGQADIVSGMAMDKARARELAFFKASPHYADLKNVGTGFLAGRLADHLTGAIRRQLPAITQGISSGIAGLERELASLGGPAVDGRGGMVHLLLQLCRQFEDAFAAAVDGGKNGGEAILSVFEKRLADNIARLGFSKILEPANVRRVVEEADGYQPHLVAPEMGYRRLLQECLALFARPADTAVEEVHAILRQIVARTLDAPECAGLAQYAGLRASIARAASSALDAFKADARAMVLTLVEMERSYLTAEVFKEILAQSGSGGGGGGGSGGAPELVRTLSGRPVSDVATDEGGYGAPGDRHLHRIAVHVSAYITHVRTQLKQTIPKAIVHTLVLKSKKDLLEGLHKDVAASDDGNLRHLLAEDEATVKRRAACQHRLKLLRQAADEVAAASF